MNKSLSIGLGGLSFFIEQDAYKNLENYLKQIEISLQKDDDVNEIIKDVESRIAELFKSYLGISREVIQNEDVEKMKSIMGTPEQFAGEELEYQETPKTSYTQNATTYKKLFRDYDNKILGGVLAGISNYFGIDIVWIRLAFILIWFLGLFTIVIPSFFMIMVYVILWVIVPKAITTSEKLQMHGKPANFDNIKQYVNLDKAEIDEAVNKVGSVAKSTGKVAGNIFGRFFELFGKIIKIFIGIFLILFSIGMFIPFFIEIFPWSLGDIDTYEFGSFLFDEKWMVYTAVILIAFLFIIPAFYIMILGFRLLSKQFSFRPANSIIIVSVFIWFSALIGLAILGINNFGVLGQNYIGTTLKYPLNTVSDTLEVRFDDLESEQKYTYYGNHGSNFSPSDIIGISKDNKFYLLKVEDHLSLKESEDNHYILEIVTKTKGKNDNERKSFLESISYEYKQIGNKLILDRYFKIPKTNKYRAQEVSVILHVPKNKFVNTKSINWVYNEKDGYDDDFRFYSDDKKENLFTFKNNELECLSCNDEIQDLENSIDNLSSELDDLDIKFKNKDGNIDLSIKTKKDSLKKDTL